MLARFGPAGLEAGIRATNDDEPVADVARSLGFSITEAKLVANLYDTLGLARLPLTDAQRASLAEADRLLLQGKTQADMQGAMREGMTRIQHAAELYERTLGADHLKSIFARGQQAQTMLYLGELDQAELILSQALGHAEANLGGHVRLSDLFASRGILMSKRGMPGRAVADLRRALSVLRMTEGSTPSNPTSLVTMVGILANLAAVHVENGAFELAEPLCQEALALIESNPFILAASRGAILSSLASIYRQTRRLDKAEQLYLRALHAALESHGAGHPITATALNNLALLYSERGQHEKALQTFEQALAILEARLGPEHPHTVITLMNMALIYEKLEEHDLAASFQARARRAKSSLNEAIRGSLEHNDALHSLSRGNPRAAVEQLRTSAHTLQRTLPASHPNRIATTKLLGMLLWGLGHLKEARVWLTFAEEAAFAHFRASIDLMDSGADLAKVREQYVSLIAAAISVQDARGGLAVAMRWQGAMLMAEMLWRDLRRVAAAEFAVRGQSKRIDALRAETSRWLRLTSAALDGEREKSRHEQEMAAVAAHIAELTAQISAEHPDFAHNRSVVDLTPDDICRALHVRGGPPMIHYTTTLRMVRTASGAETQPYITALVIGPLEGGTCRYDKVELVAHARWKEAHDAWHLLVLRSEECMQRHRRADQCTALFEALDRAGAALRSHIWDPLVLSDATGWLARRPRILVVPDPLMAGVPLASLPDHKGRYLVERHAFEIVSFPGATTLTSTDEQVVVTTAVGASPLVFSDVNYGRALGIDQARRGVVKCAAGGCSLPNGTTRSEQAPVGGRTSLPDGPERTSPPDGPERLSGEAAECGPEKTDWRRMRSTPHPGQTGMTLDHALAMTLAEGAGRPVRLAQGAVATEGLLRELMPGAPIVHIQTHGYFINMTNDSVDGWHCAARHAVYPSAFGEDRAVRWKGAVMPNGLPVIDVHRLSGIVLAGRNGRAKVQARTIGQSHRALKSTFGPSVAMQPGQLQRVWTVEDDPQQNDDGLLRARDILNLELSGTRLVVLAACQTGIGRQMHGEGALGLGRAFLIAGAKNVVVSKWRVPFRASSDMFEVFYRALADGVPTPRALRLAQVETIEALRRRGIAHSAFMWGAFIPIIGG